MPLPRPKPSGETALSGMTGPVALVVCAALAAGCSSGGGSGAEPVRTAPPAAATAAYTPDQLRQALIADVPGYARAGEPDSGPYAMLKAIRNFTQLQSQVTLDKPACAGTAQTLGTTGELASAPAALLTFAKATGETITETMVSVSAATAEQEIGRRVSKLCKTFRAKVGGQWSTHQVIEQTPDRHLIGEGSRTVGLVTMSGDVKVNMWFVVFTGAGYIGTISVYGPQATRNQAEQLARDAYGQAQRVLG